MYFCRFSINKSQLGTVDAHMRVLKIHFPDLEHMLIICQQQFVLIIKKQSSVLNEFQMCCSSASQLLYG